MRPIERALTAILLLLCPFAGHGLTAHTGGKFYDNAAFFGFAQPNELPAGSPGGKITFNGIFDPAQVTTVCFYTGYGSSATPITPNFIDAATITFTVPADSIQDIPSDQINGFQASVYALAPSQTTCDGSVIDTFTNVGFVPIVPPTINGVSLTQVPDPNLNLSTVPPPNVIILQGDGFLAGSTSVTINDMPVAPTDFVVTSINTVRVNLPLNYGSSEGARFVVCTTAGSNVYCSSTLGMPRTLIIADPATLTATPNPTTTTTSTTLTDTLGDPTTLAGIPTGTVTFADNGTTLGTAPLKIATGTFQESFGTLDLGTSSLPPIHAVPGDFNKDGVMDYATILDNTVSIYSATDIRGSFARSFVYETGSDACPTAYGIAAADFNHDGYTDLAILCNDPSDSTVGNVLVFFNAGDGGFSYAPSVKFPVPVSAKIVAGDFQHNGNIGLVVANSQNPGFTLITNDGFGNFTVGTTSPASYASLVDLQAVDLNGDGFTDLLGIQVSMGIPSQPVVAYQNNGSGGFPSNPSFLRTVADGQSAFRVFPRLLPGKSYPDLVVLNSNSMSGTPEADMIVNTVTTPGGAISYDYSNYATSLPGMLDGFIGDYDGDGYPDLLVVTQTGITVYPATADTLGRYLSTSAVYQTNTYKYISTIFGVSDLNADGYPDLVGVGIDDDGATEQYLRSFVLAGTATATLPNVMFTSGTHPLTASHPGNYTYAVSMASLSLDSTAASVTPTVTLGTTPVSPLAYGPSSTFTLDATVQGTTTPPAGNVTFNRVDNGTTLGSPMLVTTTSSAAAVSLQVGPLPVGTYTFSASFPGDSNYTAANSSVISVIINKATPTLAWTPGSSTIPYGTALSATQLNATATLGGNTVAGTFTYTEGATTVSAGTILPTGTHNLTVNFTPSDSANYAAPSALVGVIKVTQDTPTVSYSPTPATITYGTTVVASQLNATASFGGNAVAGTFTYSSASKPVVVGTVLPAGMNVITATFTPTDTTNYAGASGNGTVTVTAATPVVSYTPTPASITYGTALVASQLNASASFGGNAVTGTFAYSVGGQPVSVGTVLPAGTNTITATFTPSDATDYTTASSPGTVTVTAATPTITYTPTPNSITYGTALVASQLNASASFGGNNVPGTFGYKVNGSAVSVGTVLAAGSNIITATFTPADATTYAPTSQTGTIAVTAATPTVTYAPTPNSITYGTALVASQLNATATFGGNSVLGAFTYTVNGSTVAVGAVLPAGSNTITATFSPTDTTTYNAASKPATISVTAAAPTITYTPTPTSITYGTALVASQLNAAATFGGNAVAGTFSYLVNGSQVSVGTVLPAGNNIITATFTPSDSTTYTTANKQGTVSVTAATPTVSYSPTPASITYGTALVASQLNATATFGGNAVAGTFSYLVNGSQVAAGAVLPAGNNIITATFTPSDSTTYTTANKQGTVSVTAATPTVSYTPTPSSITYGTALVASQLNATATFGGNTVAGTFSYLVNGSQVAVGTVLSPGNNIITATFTPSDSTTYTTANKQGTVAVTAATPIVSYSPTPASITYGTALVASQLNATATFGGNTVAGTFSYLVNGQQVAVGTVLPAGTNTITATFTPADTATYTTASKPATLSVTAATPTISYTPAPASITYGTALVASQLNATATFGGNTVAGTFSYLVNGSQVAIGTVLPAGNNTITATFTPSDGTTYTSANKPAIIAVMAATPTVSYAPTPTSISYGTALVASQLNATATFGGNTVAGTIAYLVNGQQVAAGTVLSGGANIISATFTPTDTTTYTTASAQKTITVTAATPTVVYTPTPNQITYGTALIASQLNATATFGGNAVQGTFAYALNGQPVSIGTVLPVGTNGITATFTPTDTTTYTTANKVGVIAVSAATPTITYAPTPASITYGTPLVASQLSASANFSGNNISGTFAYSVNGQTVSVGTVLPVGTSIITATFTPTDGVTYSSASKQGTVTVTAATPILTYAPTPATIVYGTALVASQLNAAATFSGNNVPGTFAYAVAGKAVSVGTVLPAGANTITATFTPSDSVTFTPATQQGTVTVTAATPTITYAPTPTPISYGTALVSAQLNATATFSGNAVLGTFVYTVGGQPVSVGSVLSAGANAITATFTPTDSVTYTSAAKTASIAVTQATPIITWPAPAAITLGTALSSTQLNATATNASAATVAGTFAYTPATGTVLPRGTNSLSVTFTPADTINYTTANSTNSIAVNPAVTTTAVSATPNPSQYGQSVTFTVSVTSTYGGAAITGPLSVFDGQTLIGTTTLPGNTVSTSTLGAGPHSITAVYGADNNFAGSTSAVLTQTVSSATTVLTWPQPANIVYGTKLSATQLNAAVNTAYASSVPGTFAYTPAAGTVLGAGPQTLSVTFTPTDANSYKPVTGTVSLVVTKANPALQWATPAPITAGTALSSTQLNASATDISGAALPGSFVYTPATGATPGVGSTILSTAFTPTDATDYNTATLTVPLTVNPATSSVSVTSSVSPSQFGQPVMLTATITSSYAGQAIGGSVTFLDGQTTLGTATVTNGVANFSTSTLAAGLHRVVASYTGDANFNAATSQAFNQTVNAATLTITWPTPSGITYGTALSATQLNATVASAYASTVPGTFAYTPAAGVVPTAGTQTLSVTFTPTDTTSFQPVTSTVTLAVAKATPTIAWKQPADVPSGTTLSSTQLNATFTGISGTLPGTAVYNPAAGTVVFGGQTTLSVTFTPTDTVNYTTATTTVPLNVIGLGITTLSSTTALLGDAAKTLTVTGAGFVSDSTVYVDSNAVTTTYVNGTTLTAVVPTSAFLTVHSVQVLVKNPTQNTTSNALTISVTAPPSSISVTGPTTIAPTDQPNLSITTTSYPVPVTAVLTLTFTPAAGLPDDPSIVFGNGTRIITVTLPANTTTIPAVPVQGGSVAGTITISAVLSAGGTALTAPAPVVITQPLAVPGIKGVTLARSGSTLTVTLTGYSNTRNVDHIDFHFTAAPGEKLATTDLTVQGANLFGTWFADPTNNQYGGTFTYTQTFNLDQDATVVGQVQVTLVSTQGSSLAGSAQ